MMMISTLRSRVVLLIAFVMLGGVLVTAASDPPDKTGPAPLAINIPLAREQLKLIDQVVSDMELLYRQGELGLTAPEFNLWSRRRVDALRASGASKAELVAALGQHLDRMKRYEAAVNAEYRNAKVDRKAMFAAQYERLEAEMLLNQEKAR
jgi:hypothetical protein